MRPRAWLLRAATGRAYRNTHLLGELRRGGLVPQPSHHARIRPHEYDPEPLGELGELGPLGHGSPPDPRGVGARRPHGTLEPVVVSKGHRLIGLPDERRVTLGLGVHGDEADGIGSAVVELAHGMDDAHRGLTAADDHQP